MWVWIKYETQLNSMQSNNDVKHRWMGLRWNNNLKHHLISAIEKFAPMELKVSSEITITGMVII